jgi:chromosome segregation ATPase
MLVLGSVMLVAAGCGDSNTTTSEVTGEDVRKEAAEAVEATAQYTRQEMATFTAQVEDKLQTADRKMDELQAKARELQGEARQSIDQEIQELKVKRDKASSQLAELKSASANAWDDMKAGMQAALNDLDRSLEEATAKFRS